MKLNLRWIHSLLQRLPSVQSARVNERWQISLVIENLSFNISPVNMVVQHELLFTISPTAFARLRSSSITVCLPWMSPFHRARRIRSSALGRSHSIFAKDWTRFASLIVKIMLQTLIEFKCIETVPLLFVSKINVPREKLPHHCFSSSMCEETVFRTARSDIYGPLHRSRIEWNAILGWNNIWWWRLFIFCRATFYRTFERLPVKRNQAWTTRI